MRFKLCSLCAVMAQILSIYGLVAAVIMSGNIHDRQPLHTGSLQFGAGIAVGLCGMAAGFAIGIVGDAGGECSNATALKLLSHAINDQLLSSV